MKIEIVNCYGDVLINRARTASTTKSLVPSIDSKNINNMFMKIKYKK